MRRRNLLEEDAVLAPDELLALGELVIVAACRICRQPCAVCFIGSEAVDVIGGIGGGRRTLVRREIADEIGATARNDLAPVAPILRKRLAAEWVDLIADEAGNGHGNSPCTHGSIAAEAFATETVLDWQHRTTAFRY